MTSFLGNKRPILSQIASHRTASIGAVIIILLIGIALCAPMISPHHPVEQHLEDRLQSFSHEYPLGTDHLGRCILSRIFHGARVSLLVAVSVVIAGLSIGLLFGVIAGYYGGMADWLIVRLIDLWLAFPNLILILVIVGIFGQSIFNLTFALSIVNWQGYTRLVRGMVLSEKQKEFVLAARALGVSNRRIILHHILPGCLGPIFVIAALNMGHVILSIAGLGFLGLGPPPPTPEWGSILNDGLLFFRSAPHLMFFPGFAISITVLAFTLLGDGLRDIFDPKGRFFQN